MQYFFFILKSAVEDLKRNKIRTILTSLGILIGVSSVVLLSAFGLGLKKYIKGQFEYLGSNLLLVLPGQIGGQETSFTSAGNVLTGVNFDQKDVETLSRIREASFVVPAFMKTVKVTGEGKSEIGDLFATTADIFAVRNLKPQFGRLFSKSEVRKSSKKAVIGPKLAGEVFPSKEAALGKMIQIENTTFEVVGVLEKRGGGGLGGPDFDLLVYVPYTAAYSLNPEKKFFTINIEVKEADKIETVKEEAEEILSRRYDEDEFSVVKQTEILGAVTSIFSVLNMVLVAIGAVSLLVGGIGIMNIMYVSVIERTHEIGIRRAIGATGQDILFLFLSESVILSATGGLLGLGLSWAVIFLVKQVFPAYINLVSVLVAFFVSSAIGVFFGVFPARRAANLSPIEAIRYE